MLPSLVKIGWLVIAPGLSETHRQTDKSDDFDAWPVECGQNKFDEILKNFEYIHETEFPVLHNGITTMDLRWTVLKLESLQISCVAKYWHKLQVLTWLPWQRFIQSTHTCLDDEASHAPWRNRAIKALYDSLRLCKIPKSSISAEKCTLDKPFLTSSQMVTMHYRKKTELYFRHLDLIYQRKKNQAPSWKTQVRITVQLSFQIKSVEN